jgi:DNA-binding transcriptional LysR family regulator
MEYRHLRYFVAVAEDLNFTRAARRLDINQSVLSRQIRDLEREIGVQLLDRNSTHVFLTDAGSRFLSEARVVLQHAAQAVEAARQMQAGTVGTLRLGIGKGLGDLVSRIISGYLRVFPAVEIDVKDIASGFQSDAFDDRRIDVGFMRPPVDNPQLTSKPLFQERLSVVLKKTSPLAKRARIRLRDIAQENLLMIDRRISPGFNEKVLQLYRNAGVVPRIVPTETMPYEEAGAILIESGKGIYLAVGENPFHPSFSGRVVVRPLDEPDAVMSVHLIWRKNEQAKPTVEFVRYTQRMCGEIGMLGQMTPKRGASRRKTRPRRGKR